MSNLTESKLAALLKNSKAIMNKVEENTYQKGNIDPSMLIAEGDLVESPGTMTNQKPMSAPVNKPISSGQKFKNLPNSKMPKQILEAMVNNPIDIPETPFHTFDVSENLVREVNSIDQNYEYEEKPLTVNRLAEANKKAITQKQIIRESSEDIRQVIREEISKILPTIIAEYFDKRVIEEQIQVKVGNTLFSGNLKPLPSKQIKK